MMTFIWSRTMRGAILPLLLVAFATACGDSGNGSSTDGGNLVDSGNLDDGGNLVDGGNLDDGGNPTTPSVLANTPVNNASGVPPNGTISATFSEAMDPATVNASTFTVTSGAAVPVPGQVLYSGTRAIFRPDDHLAVLTAFTATITTGAQSAAGVALANGHTWSFTTGDTVTPPLPVDLRTAGNFAILAKSGVSTVPISAITGDLAVSPAAATFITGFSLTMDAGNTFATSTQVTGRVYAADYGVPTPSNLTTAVGDMELAFTTAAGRSAGVTELGAGNIGGMTITQGVYAWGTSLLIPTDVTLSGSATDVWIFQISGDLTLAGATSVILSGGALPKNVFWQVAGRVELGTTSHFEGVVLTQTSITLGTGASVVGRLLAQTAVDIDGATVVEPAP